MFGRFPQRGEVRLVARAWLHVLPVTALPERLSRRLCNRLSRRRPVRLSFDPLGQGQSRARQEADSRLETRLLGGFTLDFGKAVRVSWSFHLREMKAGLLKWLSGKETARECRRCGFDPWVGKIPWRREWHLLQYSRLENSVDRGAWRAYSPWIIQSAKSDNSATELRQTQEGCSDSSRWISPSYLEWDNGLLFHHCC